MAIQFLTLLLVMLDTSLSEYQKRLVLHSDQDINEALFDIRKDISATKQENLALKAQIAQENQLLNAKIEQEIQALRTNMTQEKQAVIDQIAHENQALRDQMTQENLALKAEITQLRNGQGSTYVRWGHTVCEGNGTQKVYSGYAAGTVATSGGGSSSTICLPETPSWATYKDGIQDLGGFVYGTEYEIYEQTFSPSGKFRDDEDVPCVLCHTTRAVTTMIPGSTTCYSGWTMEYTGYLMTSHHVHPGNADYVCVDKDPQAVLHGERENAAHEFYFTEVQCGALPCQEYPQGRELACVVCSK